MQRSLVLNCEGNYSHLLYLVCSKDLIKMSSNIFYVYGRVKNFTYEGRFYILNVELVFVLLSSFQQVGVLSMYMYT